MLNLSQEEEINEATSNIWAIGLSQIPLHKGIFYLFFIDRTSDPHRCLVTIEDIVKNWSNHVGQYIWTKE